MPAADVAAVALTEAVGIGFPDELADALVVQVEQELGVADRVHLGLLRRGGLPC
jgi:S-adenosylmethionine synthetase